jgi:flavodoxin I
MNKIAIIYSFNAVKTSKVVEMLAGHFDENEIEKVNVEDITREKFLSFDKYILGVPTWFDGELPNYWDEFVPEIEDMGLSGKTFAIFGNGDQVEYTENFVDGIGLMGKLLESLDARLIGFTSTDGYEFEGSRAVRDGKFLGLALDFENQARHNKTRVAAWVDQIKKEFGQK